MRYTIAWIVFLIQAVKKLPYKKYDVVVVGGGFYGTMLALFLRRFADRVLLVEKEKDILTKASYNNQARVHNGYHYPRSFMTAYRSHLNYRVFSREFKKAIAHSVKMVYAIASSNSKVTAQQFIKFARQIGSPLQSPPWSISSLFDARLIEQIFMVDELVFDAAILRKILKKRLISNDIGLLCTSEVDSVEQKKDILSLQLNDDKHILTKNAFICAYASINTILYKSHLPPLPFKFEWTEMPLIKVDDQLDDIGITIMDGPFFGVVPFPDRNLHTIHHVRYTPHQTYFDSTKSDVYKPQKSHYLYMIKDAARYIPCLSHATHVDSLYEIRTVLTQHEDDDGRPILYRRNYGIPGLHIVMGGKIDNVYDVVRTIERHLIV
ncbi:MAG: FAD dependent oxidoreductase [Microgenomates group bacterium GW2011_GWC1_41_8]|uniref:FAD dependent oxidoreductase n=3 Tax=Candidatus Roizmaniibacteriota TaxID=1752723 RepID=A0A0G0ZLP0_9BACT|nr:MAG: FAD dependent oxidoreductase [Candidatus Roizmanbacteria bacterium GW2011_GWB1_40_7]KKR94915.1 MAG: FAD dependent oxidoreductase [Candidatus Roizmanbacteria bacterium GW2011_GWA1_41_13]KKS22543.1 MAG: FAD dependent oxidoreductase [Microgenomates group bacterium GW2011_GWC1_41_8]KKS22986.1 MAG: FAD dependent oxidoreductase [Candidatus Roizmanbacteria bacterium GW2011_GWC2_41_7]